MERAGRSDVAVSNGSEARLTVTERSSHPSNGRTALVLYGSETGNAQDIAEEIGRLTERLRFDATVLDLDSVQLRDVVKHTVVLFAISTTGQGEMPQNARKFWKTLLSSALRPGILRKVRFSSFGLGDSSYPQYNTAHRMLHGRLLQLGAKTFCERGEGNEQHPEGHSAGFREWIVLLKQELYDAFPLPMGVAPIPDEVFIEPKWRLREHEMRDGNREVNDLNGHSLPATNKQKTLKTSQQPSPDLMPVKDAFTAHIESNDRITAEDHFQDVRLLDLRVQESISYGPGAVAVVYPKNFPKDIQAFIELMHWQDVADEPLDLVKSLPEAENALQTPSPLRGFDLSRVTLTLRWLLENVLDIMSIPRRSFFSGLVHFAKDSDEEKARQKERLLEFANPELIDELWDYTTRPKRTILEVMDDFKTIQIPWQYALSALPTMRGRHFSIASGGDLIFDNHGRTRIQLLVAIVNPPSPVIQGTRYGVCTRYMTTLKAEQQINIGVQAGYLDVQPTELEVPVVMIGPGTGLAPMRSMIHQRVAWARKINGSSRKKVLEDDVLFFGCRSERADYFFRDEWERFATNDGLTVCTAFSRDKEKPKQYVQDQIRAKGIQVCGALVRRNGKVYVCGSSGNMPKGVRLAIVDVLVEHAHLSAEDAEAYLSSMEKQGRYKQETW